MVCFLRLCGARVAFSLRQLCHHCSPRETQSTVRLQHITAEGFGCLQRQELTALAAIHMACAS